MSTSFLGPDIKKTTSDDILMWGPADQDVKDRDSVTKHAVNGMLFRFFPSY